jgi:hypothetical protein
MAMGEADQPPLKSDECREPVLADLVELCRSLNEAGARYVVVGGFAIRAAGFIRETMDIDLLVETGVENETRIIQGMMVLPDKAVREVRPGEIGEYGVVRVGDEILVDLMKSGCGVTYSEAIKDAVWREVDGVRIPFASPQTLWRMKQTHRAKDIPDQLFLRELLGKQGIVLEPAPTTPKRSRLPPWLARLLGIEPG